MSKLEIIYRNEITTLLLKADYNVYLPVFDVGIDMIAHREADNDTKLIQQKSRWTIDKKYLGRGIWIAFRNAGEWYLAPHDALVELPEAARHIASASWTERGGYSIGRMSKALEAACRGWRLTAMDEHET